MTRVLSSFAVLALALSANACGSGPRPLVAGEDSCRYCRMTIEDPRFGAMVLTARGRLETFDSIECLAGYVAPLKGTTAPRAVWVADVEHAGRWLDVQHARFVYGGTLHSPMGRKLAAVDSSADPAAIRERLGGVLMSWTEVIALVSTPPRPDTAAVPTQ